MSRLKPGDLVRFKSTHEWNAYDEKGRFLHCFWTKPMIFLCETIDGRLGWTKLYFISDGVLKRTGNHAFMSGIFDDIEVLRSG